MGESATFEIRAIGEDELGAWYDTLADAFAEKGTPRSYFQRHWDNDPLRHIGGIWAAFDREGVLASTVRVFEREMMCLAADCSVVPVGFGGIGEVGTRASHRGQGLASQLLRRAEAHTAARGLPIALLHTSNPRTAAFYRSLGWVPLPVPTVSAVARPAADAVALGSKRVRMDEEDSVDARDVRALHRAGLRRGDFLGAVPRSDEYWRRWVASDVEAKKSWLGVARDSDGAAAGYAVFWARHVTPGGGVAVHCHEFVSAAGVHVTSRAAAFESLLCACVRDTLGATGDDVTLTGGAACVADVCEARGWPATRGLDEGWLARAVDPAGVFRALGRQVSTECPPTEGAAIEALRSSLGEGEMRTRRCFFGMDAF